MVCWQDMVCISFVDKDGKATIVSTEPGVSLMQAALDHNVRGILADCGGAAVCATCHVYVEEQCLEKLPPVSSTEDDILDATVSERKPNSRLSCQIPVTPDMEGMVVQIPPAQA